MSSTRLVVEDEVVLNELVEAVTVPGIAAI